MQGHGRTNRGRLGSDGGIRRRPTRCSAHWGGSTREHYEIAGYGTVIEFAEELGEADHASHLTETLEEEKETDGKLSGLAKQVNAQAKKSQESNLEASKKKAKRVA
jgi:hypothetical protein